MFSLCFRIWSKVTDNAGCWRVFLFWMPSSHQYAAFENRHWGGGDESLKVERQNITTHARPLARTHAHEQELENNEPHDCTNRTKTLKCPRHHFHLLFYHFITTIIIFYSHDHPPNTHTLTLSPASCLYLYLPHFFISLVFSLCYLRQWWQIAALLGLTTETAAERVKLRSNFLILSNVSLGNRLHQENSKLFLYRCQSTGLSRRAVIQLPGPLFAVKSIKNDSTSTAKFSNKCGHAVPFTPR